MLVGGMAVAGGVLVGGMAVAGGVLVGGIGVAGGGSVGNAAPKVAPGLTDPGSAAPVAHPDSSSITPSAASTASAGMPN